MFLLNQFSEFYLHCFYAISRRVDNLRIVLGVMQLILRCFLVTTSILECDKVELGDAPNFPIAINKVGVHPEQAKRLRDALASAVDSEFCIPFRLEETCLDRIIGSGLKTVKAGMVQDCSTVSVLIKKSRSRRQLVGNFLRLTQDPNTLVAKLMNSSQSAETILGPLLSIQAQLIIMLKFFQNLMTGKGDVHRSLSTLAVVLLSLSIGVGISGHLMPLPVIYVVNISLGLLIASCAAATLLKISEDQDGNNTSTG